jgi:maleylpyruvate isomerase
VSELDLTLHGYWRSSATWRVRLGLGVKGLAYRVAPVHLVRDGGEHRKEEHLARNPLGQVPVLEVVDGDARFSLTQSLAILVWLEGRVPTPRLVPSDPLAAARTWQLAEIVNAGIQPLQNLSVLQAWDAAGVDSAGWARQVIARGLLAMEAIAARTAGRCLVGDDVSLADICLVPQLYNARRFSLDLTPYPTLTRVDAALAALPAFEAAHPDRQPDAPR